MVWNLFKVIKIFLSCNIFLLFQLRNMLMMRTLLPKRLVGSLWQWLICLVVWYRKYNIEMVNVITYNKTLLGLFSRVLLLVVMMDLMLHQYCLIKSQTMDWLYVRYLPLLIIIWHNTDVEMVEMQYFFLQSVCSSDRRSSSVRTYLQSLCNPSFHLSLVHNILVSDWVLQSQTLQLLHA